jgi:hypothetical protein
MRVPEEFHEVPILLPQVFPLHPFCRLWEYPSRYVQIDEYLEVIYHNTSYKGLYND